MIDVRISGTLPSRVTRNDLQQAIQLAFRYARRKPTGTVSCGFVSDARMRLLNRTWRFKDRSTDVLAFPLAVMPTPKQLPHQWGDVLLSFATIRREAKQRKISVREECLRLTIHGMLHLLGYTHDTPANEKRMFRIQERAVQNTA